MANLNKVMLIGRLTRDPEIRVFASGGKVAQLGFAVSNRKKNAQTGQWEDEPCFIDCEVFNRGEFGKLADLVEQYLRKGHQAYLEGHLKLDQWTDKDGQKRSKLKVVVDVVQFLEPRSDGGGGGSGGAVRSYTASSPPQRRTGGGFPSTPMDSGFDQGPVPDMDMPPPPAGRGEDDIPF